MLCGVDILEIERIRHSFTTLGQAFRDRIFTESEIAYCEARKALKHQSYAARFAAKEAVSKALGTGISKGINFIDIEILNDELGKPFIALREKAKERFEEIGGINTSLSISHCENYAVAYVVIETKIEQSI